MDWHEIVKGAAVVVGMLTGAILFSILVMAAIMTLAVRG